MSIHVFIATSLDGFIATSDGGVDWLDEIPNPEKSDYGYAGFMSGIDAIMMGRNTFEKVLSFGGWPYDKPVFVLSNSLESVPEKVKGLAEIISGDPGALIQQLEERGIRNLYVDGGKVVQSFLEKDLVDELIITRIPILLGEGIPLFGTISRRLKFRHLKTETFNDSLVQTHYERVRE
jgi:dihydrofolate reductase